MRTYKLPLFIGALVFGLCYAVYMMHYLLGLILWQPDFLAFMNGGAGRFFPYGYSFLVELLGGGVVAGRVLTAFGLALVFCIIAAIVFRRPDVSALSIGLSGLALLFAPSILDSALSPSVDMLYSAFGLSLLAVCFIIAEDKQHQQQRYIFHILLIVFLALLLRELRYHAPVLLVASALAFIPAWNKRIAVYASILLAVLAALFLYANNHMGYSSAAKEQVWCGLEFRYHRLAERGVLDGVPRGEDINGYVWDEYEKLRDLSHDHSFLDYYTPSELVKHGISNYYHYIRRPLVVLGLVTSLAAILLGIRRQQAASALIFMLLYPLPLSAAYYTLRASLLTELAGLAVCIFFASEMLSFLEGRKRALILNFIPIVFLVAIVLSLPRHLQIHSEYRSQLFEAMEVDYAMHKTGASPSGVWTEDTSITIRWEGRPMSYIAHAYNSWLPFPPEIVISPERLAANHEYNFMLLLIRTPGIAQAMAASGEWQMDEVRSGAKVLYILTRKPSVFIPKPGKQ
jgi:hypothetical protein